MTNSTVLSVRIDAETKARLGRLSGSMKRSKSFLAAEAIEEFLAVQEWQIACIEKALASADSGKNISHEDVGSWIASLGTDDEIPVPKAE